MRCSCAVCTSTDPRDRRLRCSALVSIDDATPAILIDCGPDFREQLLRQGCPDLLCGLLTHSHYDHVGGVDDLRPYAYTAEKGHFPLYCRPDVARDLRARVPYCFAENLYPGVPQFDLNEVMPGDVFSVGHDARGHSIDVEALDILHGRLPILGYRIGPLGYITDASEVPADTVERLRGVDTLVINALRHTTHPSHQNLTEALSVIEMIQPRRAYLTHLSHQMGLHADVDPILPPGVSIACDGELVFIPNNSQHER